MRNRAEDLHPVTSLPLPRRAINALTRGGVVTLEETCDWSDDALLSLPQFGPSYLTAILRLATQNDGRRH